MKLKSVRLQCNAADCEAIRQGSLTRATETSLRASLGSLRLRLRSVGWHCDDTTDTDYCPFHKHLATAADTQETS